MQAKIPRMIKLPRDLNEELLRLSEKDGVAVNSLITLILRQAVRTDGISKYAPATVPPDAKI